MKQSLLKNFRCAVSTGCPSNATNHSYQCLQESGARFAFSALTLLVGQQEGHRAFKILGVGNSGC